MCPPFLLFIIRNFRFLLGDALSSFTFKHPFQKKKKKLNFHSKRSSDCQIIEVIFLSNNVVLVFFFFLFLLRADLRVQARVLAQVCMPDMNEPIDEWPPFPRNSKGPLLWRKLRAPKALTGERECLLNWEKDSSTLFFFIYFINQLENILLFIKNGFFNKIKYLKIIRKHKYNKVLILEFWKKNSLILFSFIWKEDYSRYV